MEICPVQLVADGPSHSAEHSAASPVFGAAGVIASPARDYSCIGLANEGPVPAHSGVTVCACIRFACVIRSGYLVLANQHTSSEGQGSRDLRQTRVEPY